MKKRASNVWQQHYAVTIRKNAKVPYDRTVYHLVFATSEEAGAELVKDRYLSEKGSVTIKCINKRMAPGGAKGEQNA
jgi:hypothetical protein|tara:strand:- start:1100 stop:1330 length:231 start_codon:yes stop_codon:yes gene_type:complete